MKGDFSRNTFDPMKHYRGVRMQQGRVQLDADWNEQGEIIFYRVETGTLDIIGGCGGPLHDAAFDVTPALLPDIEEIIDRERLPGERERVRPEADAPRRETEPRETATRETATRETVRRETGTREAASRETGTRETEARETEERETEEREAVETRTTGEVRRPSNNAEARVAGRRTNVRDVRERLRRRRDRPGQLRPGDFRLGAGRYYVDGILCENEEPVLYTEQPDLPGVSPLSEGGLYLLYLNVWQRHLTVLDDPHIREIALGGPDTATRIKTIWQAKLWNVPGGAGNCKQVFDAFKASVARRKGLMSARTATEQASDNPCIVPASAGYTGLENQLYRVEIHQPGTVLDASTAAGETISSMNGTNEVVVGGGTWSAGQSVEIYPSRAGSDPLSGVLAYVTNVNGSTLTLNTDITSIDINDTPRVRLVDDEATFKWSRDNGIVVAAIESINTTNNTVVVHDTGPDSVLGFSVGQWVEITDDARELHRQPGQLLQIADVDRNTRVITLKSAPTPLADPSVTPSGVNAALTPKLRRWDGVGIVKFNPSRPADESWLDLEDGVQVRFSAPAPADEGTPPLYRTGDYWQIPARTATADVESGRIEWPRGLNAPNQPLALEPFGIIYHYCPLALLQWNAERRRLTVVEDCRHLFPPLTELLTLNYVGGDGQEVMPQYLPPANFAPLPQPLVVGVSNGQWPVEHARVRFEVDLTKGNGKISSDGDALQISDHMVDVRTGADGLARCNWQLDATTPSQQVTATLLASDSSPVHLPVRFTANLSTAREVAYRPGACERLAKVQTVQDALDELCKLIGISNEPGIHIERIGIDLKGVPEIPVRNDADLTCDALANGLRVTCDRDIFPPSVRHPESRRSKPVCFVTIELPYPFNDADRELWRVPNNNVSSPILGYQPIVLEATASANGNIIFWVPTESTAFWLTRQLFDVMVELNRFSQTQPGRILARLTLKGNFIWSNDDANLYLDGQAFGETERDGDTTALRLPSGDGKRGGDFEMWVWLIEFRVELDRESVAFGGETKGRVILSGPAPLGGAVVMLRSSNEDMAQVSAERITIPAGQTVGEFDVRGGMVAGRVDIMALYASSSRSRPLNVIPPPLVKVTGVRAVSQSTNRSMPLSTPRDVLTVQQSDSVNAIEVDFSAAVDFARIVSGRNFIVRSRTQRDPAGQPQVMAGQVARVGQTNTARWTIGGQGIFLAEEYDVILVGDGADAIRSTGGQRLDGEPLAFPSGNDQEGGNFTFRLNVQAPPRLLKVQRVRLLDVGTNHTSQNPKVIYDSANPNQPFDGTVTLNEPFNAIEIDFGDATLSLASVTSGTTFVVRRVGGAVLQGSIVQVRSNTARWVFTSQRPGETIGGGVVVDVILVGTRVSSTAPAITSTEGRLLDGAPSTRLPSGDNTDGGNFTFRIETASDIR